MFSTSSLVVFPLVSFGRVDRIAKMIEIRQTNIRIAVGITRKKFVCTSSFETILAKAKERIMPLIDNRKFALSSAILERFI